jgi:hypothetical protein
MLQVLIRKRVALLTMLARRFAPPWSVEEFDTHQAHKMRDSNGASPLMLQAMSCRKREQFSERAKMQKLPLAQ